MSEENTPPAGAETPPATPPAAPPPKALTPEESAAKILELTTDNERLSGINTDLIHSRDKAKTKLRDREAIDEEAEADRLKKAGEFEELYNTEKESRSKLQLQVNQGTVNRALEKSLRAAGAGEYMPTLLKLADTSTISIGEDMAASQTEIDALVKTLKDDNAVLFGKAVPPAPSVERAIEEGAKGGYAEEMKKLQDNPRATVAMVNAIKRKYGK